MLVSGRTLILACLAVALGASRSAAGANDSPAARNAASLFDSLHAAAPGLDQQVLATALEAHDCASRRGLAGRVQRLGVIDYSLPSTQPRLWIFDLQRRALVLQEYVAHGKGTGDNLARAFSNEDGSHRSSLGLFRTAETYMGGHGYSLRLDGLESGFNDRARDRAIVIHGAWYVDPKLALTQGRLGRSLGCPAVRPQAVRPVIDALKDGQLLFAYYPEDRWLRSSALLKCPGTLASS